MKKVLLIILILNVQLYCWRSFVTNAQTLDTLSLKYAYKLATDNYPLVKQRELLTNASKLKSGNFKAGYYPQIALNGQASYQSQVTELPIVIPHVTIPSLYKDQYKAAFDVNQLIFDGGSVNKQIALEDKTLASNEQSLEVQLYTLKNRVNQLFFNILLSQNNIKILELQKDDIKENLIKVESGIKNGVNYPANADVLNAEIINTDEQIIEINAGYNASLKMLSDLIGKTLNEDTKLIMPEYNNVLTDVENKRPELNFYDLQKSMIDVNKSLLSIQHIPKVYGFGEAGYGRPGYNFLSNQFDTFWEVGIKLSWNFWDWNQIYNQKKVLDIQKDIITSQKETFDKDLKISVKNDIENIAKYSELISKDEEVIKLRESVVNSSKSQLENQIITSTDYITELNALTQAKLNLDAHKLQLLFAKLNYITNLGH